MRVFQYFYYFSYLVFSVLFIMYLLLPSPGLPPQLPNSSVSPEPADKAFDWRPAYFTHSNRAETMMHYRKYFSRPLFMNFNLPAYTLNYPPEDSSFLVREHMYSSYLEEVVYPFRESIYINGFRPTQDKDEIWHDGINFDEKVTVKYVSSPLLPRLVLGILTVITLFFVTRYLFQETIALLKK